MKNDMNILQVFKKFPTQEHCIERLEKIRWNGEPHCPYCGSCNTNSYEKSFRHHCNGCRKSFSVTVNTIFHDSRLPLQKWFLAIALIINAKKGISAKQLQRDLDVTYKTAWSMGHRIRKAMTDNESELLTGIVEMDETYVGGKPRKGDKKKNDDDDTPKNKRGRGTKKTPVVGIVQRKGNVKAKVAEKDSLKFKELSQLVRKYVNLETCKSHDLI